MKLKSLSIMLVAVFLSCHIFCALGPESGSFKDKFIPKGQMVKDLRIQKKYEPVSIKFIDEVMSTKGMKYAQINDPKERNAKIANKVLLDYMKHFLTGRKARTKLIYTLKRTLPKRGYDVGKISMFDAKKREALLIGKKDEGLIKNLEKQLAKIDKEIELWKVGGAKQKEFEQALKKREESLKNSQEIIKKIKDTSLDPEVRERLEKLEREEKIRRYKRRLKKFEREHKETKELGEKYSEGKEKAYKLKKKDIAKRLKEIEKSLKEKEKKEKDIAKELERIIRRIEARRKKKEEDPEYPGKSAEHEDIKEDLRRLNREHKILEKIDKGGFTRTLKGLADQIKELEQILDNPENIRLSIGGKEQKIRRHKEKIAKLKKAIKELKVWITPEYLAKERGHFEKDKKRFEKKLAELRED